MMKNRGGAAHAPFVFLLLASLLSCSDTGSMAVDGTTSALLSTVDLTAIADTYLKNGSPRKNQGEEDILRVRRSGKNRVLVQFDQTALEAAVGAEPVYEARIELTITKNGGQWGSAGRSVGVHRITGPWTELGATWNCGDDTNTSNGADDCPTTAWEMDDSSQWPFEFAPTSTVLATNDTAGVLALDVTADIQAFLSGAAPNLGWVIRLTNENETGHFDFASRETATPPKLVVTVGSEEEEPEPPGECQKVNVDGDTYVRKGSPNQNEGGVGMLRVRSSGSNRALLQIAPQSLIDASGGETVDTAELKLAVSHNGNNWGDGREVDLHALLVPWDELTATWNCGSDSNIGNQQPDCDSASWDMNAEDGTEPYDPTPTDSVVVTNETIELTFDVTADVQAMIDGTAIHGWIIRKREEGQAGLIEFVAGEASATAAPQVIVCPATDGTDPTPPEDCRNGIDDDEDGSIDCADPECQVAGPDATCDGIDDDCDGLVDEDFTSQPTECGTGACAAIGVRSCVSTQLVDSCVPGSPGVNDAICDGVDEDCDGTPDEDYAPQATACGLGPCAAAGATSCVEGTEQDSCVPGVPASGDACNGIDEDCDGVTDEDFVSVPTSCGLGACTSAGFMVCIEGLIVDTCNAGVPAPDDATCDGIDDDCDGQLDEDCCVPATCQDYAINCGAVDDGCGGPLDCGTCQSPETCGGAGISNVCGVPLPPDPVDVAPMVDVGTGSMVQSFGFLTEGPTPIQTGVEEGAIVPERAAIVRGQVLTHGGQALPGVTIEVKRDPSLGQTVSRADGHYDLLINGGGSLTLEFTAVGYLPIQRTVRVPWSGFVQLEPVAMTVQSDVATNLVFDANSVDPQVAVSRSVDDGEGQRQVVGFLPAGLQATAEIDGVTVPISNGTLRMTEYTIGAAGPKAMPAVLPENSLYTFAVDISLDEVGPMAPVRFDKTVYFYLDNFLNFPVGAVVPNGRYDYETSRWVAERDGLVMEVVGIVDGLAEIDATDGDTDPEDQTARDNLGMTDDERREIASRYPVGATFWRMPVDHLSPYDWNHAGFRANPPTPEPPPRDDQVEPEDGDCEKGSIIYCQSRKLAEEVPISGTPYYLRYDSDRSQANIATGRTAIIPLPQSHPTSATEMLVQASVLGREIFNETVPLPLTTTTRTVTWDGLDAYGRTWVGAAELEYRITYPLQPAYQLALVGSISPQTARSFGVEVCDPGADPCCSRSLIGGGGGLLPRILPQPGRDATSYTIGYVKHVLLGAAGVDAFGGWSLSHYHAYDAGSGELRRGDGNTVQLAAGDLKRPTVAAGLASNGTIADDVPTTVPVYNDITNPTRVAASPDGTVYFASQRPGRNYGYHQRLWRMDVQGALEEIPNESCLGVEDLDVDNEGILHVLCANPPGIYQVIEQAPDQWVTEVVVAGAGSPWWQDGESLTGTHFEPTSMAFREDGTLFFAVKRAYNHGASERQRELVEYRSDGTGRIVGVEPGNYIGPGPNNTIVTVTRGLPGGLIRISPNGSTARLVDHSQGYQSDPLYRAKPNDFEWHSTSTHGFGGGATGSYWVTGTASGDIFVIRPSYGPPNDCGPSEKLVFQISKGRIRALSLASLPGVGFGAEPCIRPQQLSSGPGGLYAVDRHAHQIYSLASGRFATDLTGATEVPSANGSEIYRFSREGRHLSTRDALTGTEIFSFAHDPDGNLSEITDRNGHVTRIDRPHASTVVVTAPAGPGGTAGESTTLQMSSLTGHLEVITDPRQGKWFFEYTNSGLLEKLWDPRANVQGLQSGVPYMFEYEQFKSATATTAEEDARWLLKKDTDPVGGSQTLVLNHTREQTPIYGTWCDGSSYVRGYTIGESTSEVTKATALGRQVRYTTTTSTGSPVSTTRTEPTDWYVTRTDADGAASSSSEWPGGASSFTLGPHPRLAPFVHSPKSSSVSYDAVAGHAALKLDTTYDLQSTFTPSLAGFPVPDTETLTTTLTPTGVGGSQREYVSVYDGQSRTVTVTSKEGRAYSYVLDEKSRIKEIKPPGQVATVLDYLLDDSGDEGYLHTVTRQRGADVRSTTFGYDTRGYVESAKFKVSDTETNDVTMVNDPMGLAKSATVEPGLLTVASTPDITGAVVSRTPDGKPTHGLSYTPLGQLKQYASPAGTLSTDGSCPAGTQCWRYSLDRELEDIVLPDGTIVDYVHDPATGMLESVSVPEHGVTTFGHDGVGRRNSATAPTGGTMTFAWQSTLPIRTSWSGAHAVPGVPGTVSLDGTVQRFYNDFFEVSELHVTGGANVRLVRDDDGLVTDIEDLGGVFPTVTFSLSGIDGHVKGTSFGSVSTTRLFDVSETTPGFGDLLSVSADAGATNLYDASYTYDDRGRIETGTERVESGASVIRKFAYDPAGRLVTVHDITGGEPGTLLEEYVYDGNGNRQKAVSSYPGAVPLNAELGTNLGCTGPSGDTAANDQDQLCQYGDYDYVYNARGQLESRSAGGVTTDYTYDGLGRLKRVNEPGMDIHYVHDALGRRIGKLRDGNLERGWLYADALNPIAELDSAGNIEATFIYGTRAHVPDAMVMTDGTVYRFITDHLGSVRLVVNAETGQVVQRMDYDSFGRVLNDTNPGFQPFGFAGGLYDDDTGLVRFGARDYDAYAGRWTAKDPILFGGGTNLYGYVGNDPVNYRDPSGRFLERIFNDPGQRGANSENAVHHYDFVDYAKGRSLPELQGQADGSAESGDGPREGFRYVRDPADPSQIIDMRHFLVVGPEGEGAGLLIELVQLVLDPDSAFDAQDFFSNDLGEEFFDQYDPNLPLDEELEEFFNRRRRDAQCD